MTSDPLRQLILQDLGHLERLDRFVATEPEQQTRRLALASSPALLVHITAGNLPIPALLSIVLGLLVRSAQFVKCATGTSFLPRLFAHSIHARHPKIAACLEIAEWPGGSLNLEIRPVRPGRLRDRDRPRRDPRSTPASVSPPTPASSGYGHRVSFGYVTPRNA